MEYLQPTAVAVARGQAPRCRSPAVLEDLTDWFRCYGIAMGIGSSDNLKDKH